MDTPRGANGTSDGAHHVPPSRSSLSEDLAEQLDALYDGSLATAGAGLPLSHDASGGGKSRRASWSNDDGSFARSAASSMGRSLHGPGTPPPAPANGVAPGGAPPGAAPDDDERHLAPPGEDADRSAAVRTVLESGQGPMLELVRRYYAALSAKGAKDEAEELAAAVASSTARLQRLAAEGRPAPRGMDALLKDGLLNYLLSINPHLPPLPQQVVKFRDVHFDIRVVVQKFQPPNFATAMFVMLKKMLLPLKAQRQQVLRGVSGYLMPGTMTLVMGPTGSGKSTLHKVVAGQAPPAGGSVLYNGRQLTEGNLHRLVGVGFQADSHLRFLTVRETLAYARQFTNPLTPDYSPELLAALAPAFSAGEDPLLESRMAMLGLRKVADSPAAPGALSPDELHRLTAAELLVGSYPVHLFDRLSTTFDGKATFEIATMVRIYARVRQAAVMVSLLRPMQAVYDLFDRVLVLNAGRAVYQGPTQDAEAHFASLGYVKPVVVCMPEFLQEVTTEAGLQYLRPGARALSLDEFVAAYEASESHRDIVRIVGGPNPTSQGVWLEGPTPVPGVEWRIGPAPSWATAGPGGEVAAGDEGAAAPLTVLVGSNSELAAWKSVKDTGQAEPGDVVVAIAEPGGVLRYAEHAGGDLPAAAILERLQRAGEAPLRLQLERYGPPEPTGLYARYMDRKYVLGFWEEFRVLLERQRRLIWRNKFLLTSRVIQICVLALFNAFLFFRLPTRKDLLDMNVKRGIVFSSVVSMLLSNLPQLAPLLEERPVYHKHARARFFRPATYLLANALAGAPYSLAEAATWSVLVYFITGLALTDASWHFWSFLAVMGLTILQSAGMVRFMAFAAPTPALASQFSAIGAYVLLLFAHFLISRDRIRGYWRWLYYADPIQWASTLVMASEFRSATYRVPCSPAYTAPGGGQLACCVDWPADSVGVAYLKSWSWNWEWYIFGVGFAVIVAWIFLWNLGALLLLRPQVFRHLAPTPVRRIFPKGAGGGGREAAPITTTQQAAGEDFDCGDLEAAGGLQGPPAKWSLPFPPLVLSWHGLSYEVLPGGGHAGGARVLTDLSGWANPGEVLGIFSGSSAACKSTFLRCLANKTEAGGRLKGQVLVNGHPREAASFVHVCGFVQRLEMYPPFLTVREGLDFRAAMSLPSRVTVKQRAAHAVEVLDCVGIRHLATTTIGELAAGGAKGSIAKRLGVALELAANPSILFLDLPFDGLDVTEATDLIHSLERVGSELGRTVILTTVTPTASQLNFYSRLVILNRGGEAVYFGPPGHYGQDIMAYFEAIPGAPRAPRSTTPVQFALDVIGDGIVERTAVRDYGYDFRISDVALANARHLAQLRRTPKGPPLPSDVAYAPYWRKAAFVVGSLQRQYWRNHVYTFNRLLLALLFGLLFGSVYFRMGTETVTGTAARAAFTFALLIMGGTAQASATLNAVAALRPVYARERSERQFHALLYSVGYSLAELPYMAVTTLVWAAIACGMASVAVASVPQFLSFWFTYYLFSLVCVSVGFFWHSALPNPRVGLLMIPIVTSMWIATAGYIIPRSRFNPMYIWTFWINPMQYALNTMTSLDLYCDVAAPECSPPGCASDPAACPACRCPRLRDAGNEFVWTYMKHSRLLDPGRKGLDWLFLILLIVLCRLASYTFLRTLPHNKNARS